MYGDGGIRVPQMHRQQAARQFTKSASAAQKLASEAKAMCADVEQAHEADGARRERVLAELTDAGVTSWGAWMDRARLVEASVTTTQVTRAQEIPDPVDPAKSRAALNALLKVLEAGAVLPTSDDEEEKKEAKRLTKFLQDEADFLASSALEVMVEYDGCTEIRVLQDVIKDFEVHAEIDEATNEQWVSLCQRRDGLLDAARKQLVVLSSSKTYPKHAHGIMGVRCGPIASRLALHRRGLHSQQRAHSRCPCGRNCQITRQIFLTNLQTSDGRWRRLLTRRDLPFPKPSEQSLMLVSRSSRTWSTRSKRWRRKSPSSFCACEPRCGQDLTHK